MKGYARGAIRRYPDPRTLVRKAIVQRAAGADGLHEERYAEGLIPMCRRNALLKWLNEL